MSKLVMVTLCLELDDDAPTQCEETWAGIALQSVSGLSGIGNIDFEPLPYASLDDCPDNQTLH